MRNWCQANGIENFYVNYQDMLKKVKLDAVHDCTPNHMHFEVNKAILESGRHVYSEKPLTLRSSEALELCRLAKEKDRLAAVNFNYRNNAMVQEMKGRVQEGGWEASAIFNWSTYRIGCYMIRILIGGSAGRQAVSPGQQRI